MDEIPGSGAAGGLGAGLIAFLGGELVAGVKAIGGVTGLDEAIRKADLVITGEGKIDSQTQYGKTPYGVAVSARNLGKPVIAVTGTVGEGAHELFEHGIDTIFSILDAPMNLDEAIEKTPSLLEATGERIGRLISRLSLPGQ